MEIVKTYIKKPLKTKRGRLQTIWPHQKLWNKINYKSSIDSKEGMCILVSLHSIAKISESLNGKSISDYDNRRIIL
jgi:hypothetical protein